MISQYFAVYLIRISELGQMLGTERVFLPELAAFNQTQFDAVLIWVSHRSNSHGQTEIGHLRHIKIQLDSETLRT